MSHTIQSLLQFCITELEAADIENVRFEARLLVGHVLGVETHILVAYPEREASPLEWERLKTLVARRHAREPMSQIMGAREFWSLDFKVTKDTLSPRPDSETLVEAVLSHIPEMDTEFRVLDLGVGTGCLILSVLHEYENATGLGVDLSDAALSIAHENAHTLGLKSRVDFKCANWAAGITEKFDLILSNPPYIPEVERDNLAPEVKDYEPASALFAGDDGLKDYKRLAQAFPGLLNPQGICVLELGKGQEQVVSQIMKDAGLSVVEQRKDLAGIVRCLVIQHQVC